MFNIVLFFTVALTSCSWCKIKVCEDDFKFDQYFYNIDYKSYTGVCVTEYKETGNIKSERRFVDGIPDGKTTLYYQSGKKRRTGCYKDGEYQGKWWGWYDDGTPEFEVEYKNGKLNGTYITYWKDGKIKEKGIYADNVRTGKFTYSSEGKE